MAPHGEMADAKTGAGNIQDVVSEIRKCSKQKPNKTLNKSTNIDG